MVPRLVPCLLLGVGLSSTFVYIAFSSPTSQTALSDVSSFRDAFLTGRHTDRNRRFSLQPYETIPLLLSFVVAALANACGVGGGAFFVPMFNVLLGFSLKGSTALSQAVVTGGALAGFMYSSFKRHPDDHEVSLIDFDLALILTPVLLLGITAGVLINAAMPTWLITVLLVLVLTWLTVKTLRKGRQLHCSEVAAQQQEQLTDCSQHGQAHGADQGTEPESSAIRHSSNDQGKVLLVENISTNAYNTVNSLEDNNAMLASGTELDMESGQLLAADSDNGGGHQRPSHLGLCIPWKVIQFGELSCLWAAFLALQYGKAHRLRSAERTELQDPLLSNRKAVISHHDWPKSKLMRCVLIVLFGGIVAGMLGFGGGMILNPLMLEMGINPLVSSATSSVMVLFSASAATFSFAVSGRLNHQYALVYGGVCAVASIIGVAVISTSVRRSGKGSRIVFTLALIIATGAVMQALFGGAAAVRDIRTGRHVSFSSLC